jgi:PAS domain S-box-containing protein
MKTAEKIQVLILEDHVLDAQVLRASLENYPNYPFRVAHFPGLKTAMDWLETNTPDVILLDLGLEDSHGLETLQKVHCRVPEIPLVVITGTLDEDLAGAALQAGAHDYLVKTEFRTGELVRAIRYAIERHKISLAQQQSQQAIRQLEKRSTALIENAPDGIVLVSQEGSFLFASPSARKLFGYREDQELVEDPAELTHPEDLPTVLATLTKLRQDPARPQTLQYRFRHVDGTWHWIESTFTNLLADPSVGAIVINFKDITDRKQAEAQIEENERRHRLIAGLSVEINTAIGLREKLQTITERTCQVTGAQLVLTCLAGETDRMLEIFSAPDQEAHHQAFENLAATLVAGMHLPLHLTRAEFEVHPAFLEVCTTAGLALPPSSLQAVPLTGRDNNRLGFLLVANLEEDAFSPGDEAVLIQLAQVASGTIEQERLLQATRQRLAEQEAINEILRSVRAVATHHELLEMFMERCLRHLEFRGRLLSPGTIRADDRLVLLARQRRVSRARSLSFPGRRRPHSVRDGCQVARSRR